jgi:hypothetical protein
VVGVAESADAVSRWLVTGAGGMLGRDLMALLEQRGTPVVGLARQELDVTDAEARRGLPLTSRSHARLRPSRQMATVPRTSPLRAPRSVLAWSSYQLTMFLADPQVGHTPRPMPSGPSVPTAGRN